MIHNTTSRILNFSMLEMTPIARSEAAIKRAKEIQALTENTLSSVKVIQRMIRLQVTELKKNQAKVKNTIKACATVEVETDYIVSPVAQRDVDRYRDETAASQIKQSDLLILEATKLSESTTTIVSASKLLISRMKIIPNFR